VRLANGKLVSQVLTPDAFEEDCRLAAVVVTSRALPGDCKAIVIDRKVSRGNGAIALRWNGDGFDITAARPGGQDRPWARGSATTEAAAAPAVRSQPRDATPRADDLEAGD
jgi:competence protein ComEC